MPIMIFSLVANFGDQSLAAQKETSLLGMYEVEFVSFLHCVVMYLCILRKCAFILFHH